ncbi:TPA: hypothetical protein DCQ44_03480 [Candidatus Taylorbacteria bacterium]|nr:hypothetical protein [Candidatus Taylorbacteria bacterium]
MKLFGIELGTISLLVAFSWFVSFGNSVLPTHLIAQGLTIPEIFFGSFLLIVGQLVLLTAIGFKQRTYSFRRVWTIALSLYAIFFILSSFQILSLAQYYIASLIAGIASCLFYLFYNIRYFSEQKEDKTYGHAAQFFNILIIISLIAPFLSGLIGSLNFSYVAVLTLFFFLIALVVARSLPDQPYSFSMAQSYRSAYGAKLIIFLNGLYDSLGWGIITVFTLRFIQTPFSFGAFASYLAIVALISNYLVGKVGDKFKKGHVVVAVSSLLAFVSIILMGFSSTSFYAWIIANGVMKFISPIFSSTTLGLAIDRSADKLMMLHAREMLMNFGRFVGLAIAGLMMYFSAPGFWFFALPACASIMLGALALRKVKINS